MKRNYYDQSMEATQELAPPLRLFVYGTLRRGESNHERFCFGASSIQDAWTTGKLHRLPSGLLMLEPLQESILAVGTIQYESDLSKQEEETHRLQQSTDRSKMEERNTQAFVGVPGEFMIFPDGLARIPGLDRFEGFWPGQESFYRRLLLRVQTNDGPTIAWAYAR